MSDPRRTRLLMLTVGLDVGGAEELVRQSLPRIREEGFEVTVASLKRGGRLSEEIRRTGVRVESLGGVRAWNPSLLGKLWGWIRQERFEVIHSHLYWANLAARLVGRSAGARAVINSHHGTDAWLAPSRRWAERSTASLADRIVACSEAVRRRAVEIGLPAAKVVTVANGVQWERFGNADCRQPLREALGILPGQMVVGTVGRLDEPVKGLAVLLEALETVAQRIPEVVCLCAGEGPARPRLEAEARRRGLGEKFIFLGERRDVPDLLQAFDVYVQPSILEGFGLSALEAMAAGKAVVASRAGGLPEVVEDSVTGTLVPPGQAPPLAAALLALLQDPAGRSRMAAQGAVRARERFPLDRMVRGWIDLYREVLSARTRREAA